MSRLYNRFSTDAERCAYALYDAKGDLDTRLQEFGIRHFDRSYSGEDRYVYLIDSANYDMSSWELARTMEVLGQVELAKLIDAHAALLPMWYWFMDRFY